MRRRGLRVCRTCPCDWGVRRRTGLHHGSSRILSDPLDYLLQTISWSTSVFYPCLSLCVKVLAGKSRLLSQSFSRSSALSHAVIIHTNQVWLHQEAHVPAALWTLHLHLEGVGLGEWKKSGERVPSLSSTWVRACHSLAFLQEDNN